jgi:hypothetical protein
LTELDIVEDNHMKENHFLRPSFTKFVIERLSLGDSINLHGEAGIGKTRLLEDIKSAEIKNTHVIHVSFQKRYKAFCNSVFYEAGLKGEMPESLNLILDKLQLSEKRIFFLIDDFHRFPDNPEIDPEYDQAFVETLNAIKNRKNVSLLVVTHKPIPTALIFADKEKPDTSTLHFSKFLKIDSLQYDEIKKEIERRFKKCKLKDKKINILISHLNKYANNYTLLRYYEPKILIDIAAGRQLKKKRLNNWKEEFKKDYSNTFPKKLYKFQSLLKSLKRALFPNGINMNFIKKLINMFFSLKK